VRDGLELADRPPELFARLGVSEDVIEDAARVLIDPAKLVWVIVGDRATIERSLQLPGITNIHHIDADSHPV